MEIKLNTNIDSVGRIAGSQPKKIEAKSAEDKPAFAQSEALNEALHQTPDVRPSVVANGKELAANPLYPPTETIKKIATLLAKNIAVET